MCSGMFDSEREVVTDVGSFVRKGSFAEVCAEARCYSVERIVWVGTYLSSSDYSKSLMITLIMLL